MSWHEKLYARMPLALQHAAVSSYGVYWKWLRFGPGYRQACEEFRQRDEWSANQWANWTQNRLKEVLSEAVQRVPYYRDHWTAAQRKAATEGRLEKLPLLEKSPLRETPVSFISDRATPSRLKVFQTSGSTGTSIDTYWNVHEMRASMAVREVRSANWAGTSFRRARATLSARMVEPRLESKGPFYRFNLAERQVYLSAFHLAPANVPRYVEALRRHRVRWYTGYANATWLLARSILELGLDAPRLDAVITTSEKITDEKRAVIEEAFHCRVYEEYSSVENVVFASECESGRLHVSPDVGIVEILREDGSPTGPEEVGEIVVTGLMRTTQPLVRFRIGDLAAWSPEPCSCGRAMPVLQEISGRIEEVVLAPNGWQMAHHGMFDGLPQIVEGQVVQEAIDRIRLRVVPARDYDESVELELGRRVRRQLGDVAVVVETVDQIERTPAGKFRLVVSKLSDASHERT